MSVIQHFVMRKYLCRGLYIHFRLLAINLHLVLNTTQDRVRHDQHLLRMQLLVHQTTTTRTYQEHDRLHVEQEQHEHITYRVPLPSCTVMILTTNSNITGRRTI
ncbi:unnamed protein product [Amoebophrya sp. A25]|nr:unnamed protein product [Amoebophrya sp. A25]|eukprot:GSA25T00007099001.1